MKRPFLGIYLTFFFYLLIPFCYAQNLSDTTLLNIAGTYIDSSSYQQALDTYAELTARHPQSPKRAQAIYYIGKCYYRLGNLDKANEVFDEILSKYSTSSFAPNAKRMLGYVLYDKGDYLESLAMFDRFIQEHPNSDFVDDAKRRSAAIRHKLGKLVDSVAVYNSILNSTTSSDSTKADAQMQKGGLIFEIAKGEDTTYHGPPISWDTVRVELSKVFLYSSVGSRPSKARASVMTGETYFYEKNYSAMMVIIETTLTKYNDLLLDAALCHYSLGRGYQELGNYTTALVQFNYVITNYHETDVTDASLMTTIRASCWFEIATCSILLGDTTQFELAVNQILENYPDTCVGRAVQNYWGIKSPFQLLVKKQDSLLARRERMAYE